MMHFITFGDENFKNQSFRLASEAINSGWFESVTVESPETIEEFHDKHDNFIRNNERGYGYWIWKPYIIGRLLSRLNMGDFLFYTDAGATIVPHRHYRLLEYIEILEKSDKPVLTFSTEYKEKQFQKISVLNRFKINEITLSENDDFLESNQVESGIFLCRKNEFSEFFVNEWQELVLADDYSLVDDRGTEKDQIEDFIDHRHDQSILSILCKMYETNILCCNEAYGLGPFFSSRLSDKGPREFAPDSFRTDPRYDPYRHFTWKEWTNDYGN